MRAECLRAGAAGLRPVGPVGRVRLVGRHSPGRPRRRHHRRGLSTHESPRGLQPGAGGRAVTGSVRVRLRPERLGRPALAGAGSAGQVVRLVPAEQRHGMTPGGMMAVVW